MEASPREPERTCLACRRRRARGGLIRIVRGPAGEACFDPEARLPGRGAWVCADPACVGSVAAAGLARALRAPVVLAAPAERRAAVAAALARRVAGLLQIARKSRAATFGPAGTQAALAAGRAGLVLLAGELPGDAAAAWRERAGAVPVLPLPAPAEPGTLAGRAPAAAAAVARGGLAEALAGAVRRWRAFSGEMCENKGS